MARPALKRPVVEYIQGHYGISQRRACRLVKLHRSACRYRSVMDPKIGDEGGLGKKAGGYSLSGDNISPRPEVSLSGSIGWRRTVPLPFLILFECCSSDTVLAVVK